MNSSRSDIKPKALRVSFAGDLLKVVLIDGQTLNIPLTLFPRLKLATRAERQRFELMGDGEGIYWPALEEDISIEGLIKQQGSAESPQSILKWAMARKDKSTQFTHETPSIEVTRPRAKRLAKTGKE